MFVERNWNELIYVNLYGVPHSVFCIILNPALFSMLIKDLWRFPGPICRLACLQSNCFTNCFLIVESNKIFSSLSYLLPLWHVMLTSVFRKSIFLRLPRYPYSSFPLNWIFLFLPWFYFCWPLKYSSYIFFTISPLSDFIQALGLTYHL